MFSYLTILTLFLIIISCTTYSKSWVIPDLETQFKTGGGKKMESGQFASFGEKGEKGNVGQANQNSGVKGNHDKEGNKGSYALNGNNKKSQHSSDEYYEEHHKGEKGGKGHSFEEHGHYAKGHSTKGAHKIHKLNEFKKKTDFYDEEHDEAFQEKHGGFENLHESKAGASNKGGHSKKVYLEGEYGQKGAGEGGSYYAQDSGHNNAAGHEEHYANNEKNAKEGGKKSFKQSGFEH